MYANRHNHALYIEYTVFIVWLVDRYNVVRKELMQYADAGFRNGNPPPGKLRFEEFSPGPPSPPRGAIPPQTRRQVYLFGYAANHYFDTVPLSGVTLLLKNP